MYVQSEVVENRIRTNAESGVVVAVGLISGCAGDVIGWQAEKSRQINKTNPT